MTTHTRARRFPMSALLFAAALAAGLIAGCGGDDRPAPPPLAPDAPNVVLIVIDTQRADRLGCYGGEVATPRIDELARDGVVFENCVTHAPITGPSHAAMFTSRMPSELGVLNNVQPIRGTPPILAELLSRSGYATGAAVSLATMDGAHGFARGFDRYRDVGGIVHIAAADTMLPRCVEILDGLRAPFFALWHFSDPHEPYNAHGLVDRRAVVELDGAQIAEIPTSTFTPMQIELELPPRMARLTVRSDTLFTVRRLDLHGAEGANPPLASPQSRSRQALFYAASIGAAGDREATLTIALSDNHGDLRRINRRYDREVEFVDRHVGALLDTLRARGLYDDALIILAGDHGEGLGQHNEVGHVNTLYDSLLRVPLIIKPPRDAGIATGARRDDPAALSDVTPTVLGAAGLPVPEGMHGVDLLNGAPDPGRLVFSETHRPEAHHTRYSLRGAGRKVIWTVDAGRWELYDLREDPGELENLFQAGDEESETWRGKLRAAVAEFAGDGEDDGEDRPEVDAETRKQLRALGY